MAEHCPHEMELIDNPKLSIVQREFLQLVEPAQLQWPDGSRLKLPEVQAWIFDNMFNAQKIPHLPPQRYQLRVLKLLIPKLEGSIEDPQEDVWSSALPTVIMILLDAADSVFERKRASWR